ncbi:phosphatidylglycerophosphatase A [Mycoplasmatota bacterium]|nr:phosphatidylglycerophosphatase A [Mycoplasmatota bacterium]
MMEVDYELLNKRAIELLEERGVTLLDIAKITFELQREYYEDLTVEECLENVRLVLSKREVTNTVLTGIAIDTLAESGHIQEPLRSILLNDYSLYGIDEVLAYSIVNVYGSIGLTNFGYVDKVKLGKIGEIDKEGKEKGKCNTFLDDIIGAIAAAAASRIAHTK